MANAASTSSSLYANEGSAFLIDGQQLDMEFGALVRDSSLKELPLRLAERFGYSVVQGAGGGSSLDQGLPPRCHILLEYFTEGASVAKQLGMNGRQTAQLLAMLDTLIQTTRSEPPAGVSPYGLAVSTWARLLDQHSPDKDALGVEAGTEDLSTPAFSAVLRSRLDSWIQDAGPLLARHWAMLRAAVSAPDTRARMPVHVKAPVETPMPILPLSQAQLC